VAESFDPYVKWLAIRDPRRPPDHYTLLGLQTLEDDPDVIANAADQRMTHIRTFAAGRHSEQSQQILNALAAARVCLLNARTKQPYDENLKTAVQSTVEASPLPIAEAVESDPPMAISVNPEHSIVQVVPSVESISSSYRQRNRRSTGMYIAIIVGIAASIAIVGMVMFNAPDTAEESRSSVSLAPNDGPEDFSADPPPSEPPSLSPPEDGDVEMTSGPNPVDSAPSSEKPADREETPQDITRPTESEPVETKSPDRSDLEPPSPAEAMPADNDDGPKPLPNDSAEEETKAPDSSPAEPLEPEPFPVPDRDARRTAEKVVDKLLGGDVSRATSPNAKRDLARVTLRRARDHADASVQFMLYELALRLAIESTNAEVALTVAREQAEHFAIDRLEAELDTIDQLMGPAKRPEQIYPLIHAVLQTLDGAIADERFPEAKQALRKATTLAKRSRDPVISADLKTTARDLRVMTSKHDRLQSVRDTLQADPSDAQANFTIGQFKATVTGNWEAAIPLLSRGPDSDWKLAAKLEQDNPRDPQTQVQLGDTWWAVAEETGGSSATPVRERAAYWYNQALPEIADEEATRLRGRIAELFGNATIWRTAPDNPVVLGHAEANLLPRCTIELWL